MAETFIPIKIHSPEDENGNRKDMFPVTGSDQVIMADGETTLTDKLDGMIEMTTIQPDHPCLWLNPMETEEG